jgi:hypothetical protein
MRAPTRSSSTRATRGVLDLVIAEGVTCHAVTFTPGVAS